MGQQVHPKAFRLNVPYRLTESHVFCKDTPIYNKDAKHVRGTHATGGWSTWSSIMRSSGSRDYGARLNIIQPRRRYIDEVIRQNLRHTNNTKLQWIGNKRYVMVEVGCPLEPSIPQSKMDIIRLAMVRVSAMFEEKMKSTSGNSTSGNSTSGTLVHIDVVSLFDSLDKPANWTETYQSIMESAQMKAITPTSRVNEKGIVSARMMMSLHPCAERLNQYIVLMIEDCMKQQDAINELRERIAIVDKDPSFGLVTHSEMNGQPQGGYRGYCISINGVVDAARRKMKCVIQVGSNPVSTLSSPISYCKSTATTKSGSRGVRVNYSY